MASKIGIVYLNIWYNFRRMHGFKNLYAKKRKCTTLKVQVAFVQYMNKAELELARLRVGLD